MGGIFLTSGCLRLTQEGDGGSAGPATDRTNTERAMTTADETERSEAGTTAEQADTQRAETATDGESEASDGSGDDDSGDEDSGDEDSGGQSEDSGSVAVSGRLVDASGGAVTAGEVISLGDPEGLSSVAPNADGTFALDLTAGSEYLLQYTQGSDGYPDDGLPDLYTIGRVSPDGDVDLGELELPSAYDVAVTVETASGEDVTDDASIMANHRNDGEVSGFELLHNPVELAGSVSFRAEYSGKTSSREVTIAESQEVTLVVE